MTKQTKKTKKQPQPPQFHPKGQHRFPERFEEVMGEMIRLVEGLKGLATIADGMSWNEEAGKEVVVSAALGAFADTATDILDELTSMDDETLWVDVPRLMAIEEEPSDTPPPDPAS